VSGQLDYELPAFLTGDRIDEPFEIFF
jgi:hypothetical protein